MNVKRLVGSGEMIGKLLLPFVAAGVTLNVLYPAVFSVGGPSDLVRAGAVAMLIPGATIWLWSVVLILTRVPRGELITDGPYALVKHPLYTGVGLLVLPAVGFLLNSWLGVVLGAVLYVGSRLYSPAEEESLAREFGRAWDEYEHGVMIGWL